MGPRYFGSIDGLVALTGTACSDIPAPETLRRLTASQRTCLITDTGEVQCVPNRQPRPQDRLAAAAIDIDLSAHACAVLASGAVACWGDDADGKLGAPSTTSGRESVITDVGDGSRVRQ